MRVLRVGSVGLRDTITIRAGFADSADVHLANAMVCLTQSVGTAVPDSEIELIEVIKGAQVGDLMGRAVRRTMLDTLAAHRLTWTARRPTEYLIWTVSVSHCFRIDRVTRSPTAAMRDQLLVRDTTIVKRKSVPVPAEMKQACTLDMRVDDLFNELARALADPTAYVMNVQYDPVYGFPRSYAIGWGHDRPVGTRVETFTPNPP